jgi:hypothetical protein
MKTIKAPKGYYNPLEPIAWAPSGNSFSPHPPVKMTYYLEGRV